MVAYAPLRINLERYAQIGATFDLEMRSLHIKKNPYFSITFGKAKF